MAGFIGFHLTNRLIKEGYIIFGLDIINDYYQVGLKYDCLNEMGINVSQIGYNRMTQSEKHTNYNFIKLNILKNKE